MAYIPVNSGVIGSSYSELYVVVKPGSKRELHAGRHDDCLVSNQL